MTAKNFPFAERNCLGDCNPTLEGLVCKINELKPWEAVPECKPDGEGGHLIYNGVSLKTCFLSLLFLVREGSTKDQIPNIILISDTEQSSSR